MELLELQLIYQQVWDKLDYKNDLNKSISIVIEQDGKDYVICLEMTVNAYYNGDEYLIKHVDIKKAWFQFPDFETELSKQYITEIENHLTS